MSASRYGRTVKWYAPDPTAKRSRPPAVPVYRAPGGAGMAVTEWGSSTTAEVLAGMVTDTAMAPSRARRHALVIGPRTDRYVARTESSCADQCGRITMWSNATPSGA